MLSCAGFINEGLSCVLAHLQITDLIQVFYGQAQALNQVQGPLRGFVMTRVLEGAPPFRDNIRTSVGRLVDQMEPEILEAVVCWHTHLFSYSQTIYPF